MEDQDIVDLYWQRSDLAISETEQKYGRYCRSIAGHICAVPEDAEECVSETWWRAWNLMPDKRPAVLSAFLGRITRNLALDRVREQNRKKRGGGETSLALEELAECVPDRVDLERDMEDRELERAVGSFVAGLPETEKTVFVLRYWYLAPVSAISERLGCSQSKTKGILFRTRKKLKAFLQEENLCQLR